MSQYLTFLDRADPEKMRETRIEPHRELFLVDNQAKIRYEMQTLFDLAAGRSLPVSVNRADQEVRVGDSVAVFRCPWPGFDEAHRGTNYYAIHGWSTLVKFENATMMANNLRAKIRQ